MTPPPTPAASKLLARAKDTDGPVQVFGREQLEAARRLEEAGLVEDVGVRFVRVKAGK